MWVKEQETKRREERGRGGRKGKEGGGGIGRGDIKGRRREEMKTKRDRGVMMGERKGSRREENTNGKKNRS